MIKFIKILEIAQKSIFFKKGTFKNSIKATQRQATAAGIWR